MFQILDITKDSTFLFKICLYAKNKNNFFFQTLFKSIEITSVFGDSGFAFKTYCELGYGCLCRSVSTNSCFWYSFLF